MMRRTLGTFVATWLLLVAAGCAGRDARRTSHPGEGGHALPGKAVGGQDSATIARDHGELAGTPATMEPMDDAHLRAAEAYAQGSFLLEEKRTTEALPYLQEAVVLAPDMHEAQYHLGLAELELGDPAAAVIAFGRAVAQVPGEGIYHRGLASALARAGRSDEAVAEYERALDIDPLSAETHFALARLQDELGDREGAIRAWRAFLEVNPRGPWAEEARRRLEVLGAAVERP